jgi:hypothetical protein
MLIKWKSLPTTFLYANLAVEMFLAHNQIHCIYIDESFKYDMNRFLNFTYLHKYGCPCSSSQHFQLIMWLQRKYWPRCDDPPWSGHHQHVFLFDYLKVITKSSIWWLCDDLVTTLTRTRSVCVKNVPTSTDVNPRRLRGFAQFLIMQLRKKWHCQCVSWQQTVMS